VRSLTFLQVPEGCGQDRIIAALNAVGFSEERQAAAVSELSGGWRMKLAIARSMLWDAGTVGPHPQALAWHGLTRRSRRRLAASGRADEPFGRWRRRVADQLHPRPEVHRLPGVARLRLPVGRARPVVACAHRAQLLTLPRAQVLTDVIHICDSKLTYYPGSFRDFQRLRPEIAAGLPSPAGAVQRAKAQLAASASSNSLSGADGDSKVRLPRNART